MSAVTFVGHATVEIDLGGTRLLTDPLLGRHLGPLLRRGPAPDVEALKGVDAVLISHMHHDHLDLGSLRRLGRPMVAPAGAATFLRKRGLGEVTGVERGDSVRIGEVTVSAVPAKHPGSRYGRGSDGAEAVGYLVEGSGSKIYFAGDTELFEGMSELGDGLDLALLPIWGWGPKLGSGHLDPERAARAVSILRPRVAVPIHWGTLASRWGIGMEHERWPRRFAELCAETGARTDVRVLRPGESTQLS